MSWDKFWTTLLLRPLSLLWAVVGPIVDVPFGWLDRRIARKHFDQLADEVRTALPFLFETFGAKVSRWDPEAYALVFDCAIVNVAMSGASLQFVRGRGEFGVNVSSSVDPNNWHDLTLVVSALGSGDTSSRSPLQDMWSVAALLDEQQMRRVIEAMSPEVYPLLARRLDGEVYRTSAGSPKRWNLS